MGARSSSQLGDEEINEIRDETGFTRSQIVRLYSRFLTLGKSTQGLLTRDDLQKIPEIGINPLGERIISAFFPVDEEVCSEAIDFRQFVRTLACFRPVKAGGDQSVVNSRTAKLRFAFRMYDTNNDYLISQDELLSLLSMMVGSNITPEQLASIADRTIIEADKDDDGMISFDEFCLIMEKVDIEQRMSIRFLS